MRTQPGQFASELGAVDSVSAGPRHLEVLQHIFRVEASGPLPEFMPEPGVAVDYVRPEVISELIRDGSSGQHHIAAWFLADPGSDSRR